MARARLALDLIAEDRDGRQIGAEGQLVTGEQRARRDAEILGASPATEAGRTDQAAAIISIQGTTERANRLAVSLGPTNTAEGLLGFRVGHRNT